MRTRVMGIVMTGVLLSMSVICFADSKEEKQAKIRTAADETLQDLYKLQPSAKGAIQNSAGYAVFKNFGTNVLVVSTASGKGLAVNSQTKQ